jgi:hypothetical protein
MVLHHISPLVMSRLAWCSHWVAKVRLLIAHTFGEAAYRFGIPRNRSAGALPRAVVSALFIRKRVKCTCWSLPQHAYRGVGLRYSPLRTRRSGPLPRSVALHTNRKKHWPFRWRRPALMARSANLNFEELPFREPR